MSTLSLSEIENLTYSEVNELVIKLQSQLAAERAKVAKVQLRLYVIADRIGLVPPEKSRKEVHDLLSQTFNDKSTDALADIKRSIFEEWCDLVCQEHPWIDRKRMKDAIRAKFGVTE